MALRWSYEGTLSYGNACTKWSLWRSQKGAIEHHHISRRKVSNRSARLSSRNIKKRLQSVLSFLRWKGHRAWYPPKRPPKPPGCLAVILKHPQEPFRKTPACSSSSAGTATKAPASGAGSSGGAVGGSSSCGPGSKRSSGGGGSGGHGSGGCLSGERGPNLKRPQILGEGVAIKLGDSYCEHWAVRMISQAPQ